MVQQANGAELDNVSIIVTESECGAFGQAGHVEYASGKAGLQYGLVKTVKNEIVKLNAKARINAVAPGWVETDLIQGRLDDPAEMWREAKATYVSYSPTMLSLDIVKHIRSLHQLSHSFCLHGTARDIR